jgi:hypothetical protein
MIDQLELFQQFKQYNVCYPQVKYPCGISLLHWFNEQLHEAYRSICAAMPKNAIYLELGSFTGAGSTAVAMTAHPTMRAYCADNFHLPIQVLQKLKPLGSYKADQTGFVDMLNGIGTQLEHFCNNTWEWRDRIAPLQRSINPVFLHQLVNRGVKPDLVLIDDHHAHFPVLQRLRVCAKHWPNATIVIDDYTPNWDGVRTGTQAAFDEGLYRREDSELLVNRLMVLRGSAFRDAIKTPVK